MAGLSKTVVGLRVFGDDLDPNELTNTLGAAPTKSARKGDTKISHSGRQTVARQGSWILEAVDRSPGDLSSQIEEILSRLTPDLSVWNRLRGRYKCDIFCGLFMDETNEGEELSPEVMAMMAARGLRLGLDIYGATPD